MNAEVPRRCLHQLFARLADREAAAASVPSTSTFASSNVSR